MRLVQRRRVQDGVDAAQRVADERAVRDRADQRRVRGREDVDRDDVLTGVAQHTAQRLPEVTG